MAKKVRRVDIFRKRNPVDIDLFWAVLQRVAGKDASKQFWKYHNEGILKKYKQQLQIGSLDSKKADAPTPPPAPALSAQSTSKPKAQPAATPTKDDVALDPYGDLIPFADPSWYQGVSALAAPAMAQFQGENQLTAGL